MSEMRLWSYGALSPQLGAPDKLCFKTLTLQFVFISGTESSKLATDEGLLSRLGGASRQVIRWSVVRVSYNALCSAQ